MARSSRGEVRVLVSWICGSKRTTAGSNQPGQKYSNLSAGNYWRKMPACHGTMRPSVPDRAWDGWGGAGTICHQGKNVTQ